MTTPEPTPEWLEKWRRMFAQASASPDVFLRAIYSEVYEEAYALGFNEGSAESAFVAKRAKDKARRETDMTAVLAYDKGREDGRRETLEEVRERYWRSRPLLFHKDTPAMLPFEHWLKKVLAEQLREADS